ncbi:MAG: DEAD/DEAH box helicase family protein [Candidatus Zhuqueibacterota bacterium]
MIEQFLYERLDAASSMGFLKTEVSDSVAQNLNSKYELRPYQVDAFARFFHCYKNHFPDKTYPLHFLFNMATGSGKTLIMAGLILYLYEQGYCNFLFFVNSTNIIEKTKDNFLNPGSIKYLFNSFGYAQDRQDIYIANPSAPLRAGRRVRVTPVENFEAVNPSDINICFTTIQKLHVIATGHGGATVVLDASRGKKGWVVEDETRQDVKVRDIERNIVQSAIARNPFFTFASLKRYFPHLASIRDFIASDDFLGGLEITFQGNMYWLDDNRSEKLAAVSGLMSQIEAEIRQQITDYEGTRDFRRNWVHEIFKDKALKFDAKNPRAADDTQFEHFVSDKDWFAFNTIYGTSEEKAFVRMLDRHMQKLQAQYEHIYLLRNEGHFAIYNYANGQAFQPDFVLFLREKSGRLLTYQLFIEPKAKILQKAEPWKLNFLNTIKSEFETKLLTLEDKKYRLVGVQFYNNEDENQFRASLESVLNI